MPREVALDDAPFVLGQALGILPQGNIPGHLHLLGHPVVGAGGEVFVPGPLVLEGHELIDVGAAVDDALVIGADTVEALRLDTPVIARLVLEHGPRHGVGLAARCFFKVQHDVLL